MILKNLIQDYDGKMTAKYKSKLDTFRKKKNLEKKLRDEYPNQYRVAEWRIPDEMVKEKNIPAQLADRNIWEQTAAKDEDDFITCIGGYHTKSIYKNVKSGLCVLVDECLLAGEYKSEYKYYIIYIFHIRLFPNTSIS